MNKFVKLKSYGTILCQVYRESSPKPLANKLPSARREKERKEEEEEKKTPQTTRAEDLLRSAVGGTPGAGSAEGGCARRDGCAPIARPGRFVMA